jgi:hypothetical protein
MAVNGVLISSAHAGIETGNAYLAAGRRIVPWALVWIVVGVTSFVGSLLLIVPGIIVGVRLFWADEFALLHSRGVVSALRESWELTRGKVWRILRLQVLVALSAIAGIVVIVMFTVALLSMMNPLITPWLQTEIAVIAGVITLFTVAVLALLLMNGAVHSAQVVYFYGLRAVEAHPRLENSDAEPEDSERTWVEQADDQLSGKVLECPHCGSPYDPDDYRADAVHIYCSACKSELDRSAGDLDRPANSDA